MKNEWATMSFEAYEVSRQLKSAWFAMNFKPKEFEGRDLLISFKLSSPRLTFIFSLWSPRNKSINQHKDHLCHWQQKNILRPLGLCSAFGLSRWNFKWRIPRTIKFYNLKTNLSQQLAKCYLSRDPVADMITSDKRLKSLRNRFTNFTRFRLKVSGGAFSSLRNDRLHDLFVNNSRQ